MCQFGGFYCPLFRVSFIGGSTAFIVDGSRYDKAVTAGITSGGCAISIAARSTSQPTA